MIRPSSEDLAAARLLRGKQGLSALDRELALAGALRAARAPRRRLVWIGSFSMFAAAAGVLLAVQPAGEFRARGGVEQPAFTPVCVDACRPGALLAFRLDAPQGYGYFAAFARASDGMVIWYVPDPGGVSAAVPSSGVLESGVRLGPEHVPGPYTVVGVFSSMPLTREAVRAAVETASAAGIAIVTRELTVGALP